MKPARRLRAETVPISIRFETLEKKIVTHHLAANFCYDGDARLTEISFVTRGIIGQQIDQMFLDLGIKLSRVIQGRNPETGEEIHDAP